MSQSPQIWDLWLLLTLWPLVPRERVRICKQCHYIVTCVGLPPTLDSAPHPRLLVTNVTPGPDPSTSSDMILLLTTQHYQDRGFFIPCSSTVNYDFVAATVCTGKYTNIPSDIPFSLIFSKILGHLTQCCTRDKIIFVFKHQKNVLSKWSVLKHVCHRYNTSSSLNPALALTWLYPGCAVVWRNFFNLITHCFPAPCNLQLWSKLFNLNSSGPKFLQLHLQHSTQVFVQCVTVSSVSNPSLHIVFDPFPSRVKINKLLQSPSIPCFYSDLFRLPSLQLFIGTVLERNKNRKLNKKEN